ncbi:MAG: TIM barrel protein [Candidatus Methanofastidiosia archaeon]
MANLLFGTAGIPIRCKKRDSVLGIQTVRELSLDAMELEFVQRVSMGEDKAKEVLKASERYNVKLSLHAPYYINLNSEDEKKIEASRERILLASRIGNLCGAGVCVIHAGFYHKDSKKTVFERMRKHLKELSEILSLEGIKIRLGIETTGKKTQFGTLEEILKLSDIDLVCPVVDFSHIHARGDGVLRAEEEFSSILESIESYDKVLLRELHMHVQGIEYSLKGERRHLNLDESDFNYKALLKVLKSFKVSGTVICESPNIEEDAMLLKRVFEII